MKKLIIVFMIPLSSCGFLQPIESQVEYLKQTFPHCKIIADKDVSLIYTLTDTTTCKSIMVEMSPWKRNKIVKIYE